MKRKMKRSPLIKRFHLIKAARGVISIFLAILMVPFVTIAGSLISAARLNSAVAVFDEALCNASNSTLGTYDKFLKSRFGLLAMKQDTSGERTGYTVEDLLNETFEKYMEENLKSLSNTYTSTKCEAQGVYPLADENVLLTGVLEFSKYSVPTKLIEDSLDLDSLVKQLENMIPCKGLLDLITSVSGTADSMVTLSEDFKSLKKDLSDEEIAISEYNAAYNEFSTSVSSYSNTVNERNRVLPEYETAFNNASSKVSSLATQIEDLETKIEEYKEDTEKTGTNHKKEIENCEKEINKIQKENESALEEYNKTKEELENKRTYYENRLADLAASVSSTRATYESKIGALIGKVTAVKDAVNTVQNDIIAVGKSTDGVITDAVTMGNKNAIQETEQRINDLEKQLDETQNEDSKASIREQITMLKDGKAGLANNVSVAEGIESGVSDAMSTMKEKVSTIDISIYVGYTDALRQIKENVANYQLTEQSGSLSKAVYYAEIPAGRLTVADAKIAEQDLLDACVKSTIWSLINSIIGFIKALFSLTGTFDPKLSANIDTDFYSDRGGLPSVRDRTKYPLNYGEAGDAELSAGYREIFGDYSAEGLSLLNGFDLIGTLSEIITDFTTISRNCTEMVTNVFALLTFATRFRDIMNAAKRIVSNFKLLFSNLGEFFSFKNLMAGSLLSGYVSYMTSNRTTYENKALTGAAFNPKLTESTIGDIPVVGEFQAMIDLIRSAFVGGSDKRFVGAETEYIIFGHNSEVINQAAAFLVIYIVKLVLDIIPIVTNTEVQSMASAAGMFAPLVFLAVFLIEPLMETLVLVNGGEEPLYQGGKIYLTPSGIAQLISDLSTLKLSSAQMDKATKEFEDAANVSSSTVKPKNTGILNVNYSKMLFIMLCVAVPRKKMVDRLADIIEMEAVVNAASPQSGMPSSFNIDKSYTYIRAEASFTTNTFIKIADESVLNVKERIIYRGY